MPEPTRDDLEAPAGGGWRTDSKVRTDTIARLDKVLELLAVHGFVEAACRQAHCAKKTYYEFRDRHPDFAEEAEQAVSRAKVELEATGWACARKALSDHRYLPALLFALKAKGGWKESTHLDITTNKSSSDPRELTDEELGALIAETQKRLNGDPPAGG